MNRPLGLLVLAAAAAALVGCGSSTAPAAAPARAPYTSAPAEPLTPQETAFLARLAKIAPPLAANPERAARRAGNTCSDLATGTRAHAIANAVQRFSGSYQVTPEQAGQIIDAARDTVCAT